MPCRPRSDVGAASAAGVIGTSARTRCPRPASPVRIWAQEMAPPPGAAGGPRRRRSACPRSSRTPVGEPALRAPPGDARRTAFHAHRSSVGSPRGPTEPPGVAMPGRSIGRLDGPPAPQCLVDFESGPSGFEAPTALRGGCPHSAVHPHGPRPIRSVAWRDSWQSLSRRSRLAARSSRGSRGGSGRSSRCRSTPSSPIRGALTGNSFGVAGCELGDVRALVAREGVENGLGDASETPASSSASRISEGADTHRAREPDLPFPGE